MNQRDLSFYDEETRGYHYDNIDGDMPYNYRYYVNVNTFLKSMCHIISGDESEKERGGYILGADEFWGVEAVLQQFLSMQEFNCTELGKEKRIYHEFISLHKRDERIPDGSWEDIWTNLGYELMEVAYEFGRSYFDKGHQALFTLHWKEGFHIHYVINSASFIDNRCTFITNEQKRTRQETLINAILMEHRINLYGCLSETEVLIHNPRIL
ncbi:MAG: hypothetical protein LUE29_00370 [Lachnospiraceae bacterium]|nr:hypothetical protein [Lachnospiraceae bacterium]